MLLVPWNASRSVLHSRSSLVHISDSELELFEGGAKVFDDFGGDDVGCGEVGAVFERFVASSEYVEVGFTAGDDLVVGVAAPGAVRVRFALGLLLATVMPGEGRSLPRNLRNLKNWLPNRARS